MFDLLRFMYPDASAESLISGSNFFVLIGWVMVFLGALGLVMESIGQRRLFYEAFPQILFGLFFIECLGMHSTISFTNIFDILPITIPVVLPIF